MRGKLGRLPLASARNFLHQEQSQADGHYRLAALESSRQPSYGKRSQLIEDGLESPSEHLKRAKLLHHPFDDQFGLKEDHKSAIEFMSLDPSFVNSKRLENLEWLQREAKTHGAGAGS